MNNVLFFYKIEYNTEWRTKLSQLRGQRYVPLVFANNRQVVNNCIHTLRKGISAILIANRLVQELNSDHWFYFLPRWPFDKLSLYKINFLDSIPFTCNFRQNQNVDSSHKKIQLGLSFASFLESLLKSVTDYFIWYIYLTTPLQFLSK